MITGLDFVAVPSTDPDRSRAFYVETLGLEPDEKANYEFWVDGTCFAIWEPTAQGMEFEPQKCAHMALQVKDIETARSGLEEQGVTFFGDTFDTGVCFMALFADPDGNALMLHQRYAPH